MGERQYLEPPVVLRRLCAPHARAGCVLSANTVRSLTGVEDSHGAQAATDECCAQLSALLASGACACEHTTDQLIVYMVCTKS